MKRILAPLAVGFFFLALDYRLMVLEHSHPNLYAAWLITVAIGFFPWIWAVVKYKRGDFDR